MKSKISREDALKELNKIRESNYQHMINVLKSEGVDASKVPRIEFDKLLRIQRDVSAHEIKTAELVQQFNTILAPYRPALIIDKDASGVAQLDLPPQDNATAPETVADTTPSIVESPVVESAPTNTSS
jgi:hypothetical protein